MNKVTNKVTKKISWKWNNPGHLDAHRKEFCRPVEDVLEELSELLADTERAPGDKLHQSFTLSAPTGRTGLVEVPAGSSKAFWAYRKGRSIPSHLCRGEKHLTSMVCLWGWWESESLFIIHTLYPGGTAPREIHDPELRLEDMAEAVAFWSTHAIITEEGEYSAQPQNHQA